VFGRTAFWSWLNSVIGIFFWLIVNSKSLYETLIYSQSSCDFIRTFMVGFFQLQSMTHQVNFSLPLKKTVTRREPFFERREAIIPWSRPLAGYGLPACLC
jgi:hypothetical protein